jgi:DNA helicase HerA-like ATPase
MKLHPKQDVIGWVIDNSAHDRFSFDVLEGKHVEFGKYYFIKHPTKGIDVLTRVMKVGYKGQPRAVGQDVLVADAEPLGYFDKDRFKPLEVPPSAWTPVYEAKPEDLGAFMAPPKIGYHLKIGNLRDLDVPIYLDVDGLLKGHSLVCGEARSGKSTFMMALAKAAKEELQPPPHMVIFDMRGEYISLVEKVGGKRYSYKEFTQSFAQIDASLASSLLGFDGALAGIVASTIEKMQGDGITEAFKEILLERILADLEFTEIEAKDGMDQKKRFIKKVEDNIKRYGDVLENLPQKPLDPVDVVKGNEVTLIDFSVDTKIDSKQLIASQIIRALMNDAIAKGDFGAIIAIEEVRYFAPDENMVKYGENWRTSLKAITEAMSKVGTYNLGFIIMARRPAYVSKSVTSQCDSVISFRLTHGDDQQTIIKYTECGSMVLPQYLSGLAGHDALVCGIAVPAQFPVIVDTRIEYFPKKTVRSKTSRIRD